MNTAAKLNKMTREIEALDYRDKVNLMGRIVSMLKQPPVSGTSSCKITDLKGLGKEIWADIDVEDYIKRERETWD